MVWNRFIAKLGWRDERSGSSRDPVTHASCVVLVLSHSAKGWRVSDIRCDDGSSLKKILEGKP